MPFGEFTQLTPPREWAIMKLRFRVPFGADIEFATPEVWVVVNDGEGEEATDLIAAELLILNKADLKTELTAKEVRRGKPKLSARQS